MWKIALRRGGQGVESCAAAALRNGLWVWGGSEFGAVSSGGHGGTEPALRSVSSTAVAATTFQFDHTVAECLKKVMDFEKDHVAPAVLRGPPPHGFRMGPSYDYKCHITLERVHEGETIRIEVAANSPDVEEWGRKAALKDWVPREPRVRRLKCTYPFAVTVERGGWAVRLRCRMDPVALTFQVGSARVVSEGEGVSPQGGPGLLGEGCRPPRSSHEALDVSGGACRPDGTSGAAPVPQRERGADTEGAPAMVASSPNRLAVSGLQARRRRPRPSQETRAALGEWLAARGLDCDVLGYLVSAVFDREQVEFQRYLLRMQGFVLFHPVWAKPAPLPLPGGLRSALKLLRGGSPAHSPKLPANK